MGKESWKPTESDIEIATCGSNIQAQACGLDLTDDKLQQFLANQIMVIATLRSEVRWLRQIIDELSIRNKKVE